MSCSMIELTGQLQNYVVIDLTPVEESSTLCQEDAET